MRHLIVCILLLSGCVTIPGLPSDVDLDHIYIKETAVANAIPLPIPAFKGLPLGAVQVFEIPKAFNKWPAYDANQDGVVDKDEMTLLWLNRLKRLKGLKAPITDGAGKSLTRIRISEEDSRRIRAALEQTPAGVKALEEADTFLGNIRDKRKSMQDIFMIFQ